MRSDVLHLRGNHCSQMWRSSGVACRLLGIRDFHIQLHYATSASVHTWHSNDRWGSHRGRDIKGRSRGGKTNCGPSLLIILIFNTRYTQSCNKRALEAEPVRSWRRHTITLLSRKSPLPASLVSAHSFSMSQSLSWADRSGVSSALWLGPFFVWSERNKISGESSGDTPSDGLISEKLRLFAGNKALPQLPPPAIIPIAVASH